MAFYISMIAVYKYTNQTESSLFFHFASFRNSQDIFEITIFVFTQHVEYAENWKVNWL